MTRPICSVVIPSYNGRTLLETCLASIARHRPAHVPIEVIVADDASTDGTLEWLAEAHPDVSLVRIERNAGFCGAANAGIAAARGSFIQLLNNDTEVLPVWIEAGLAPFEDPRVGSVAPLVLVRSDPSRVDSAGDTYAVFGWPSKRGHGQEASRWVDHPSDGVFGASGSSAFYRAEALGRVGPFDPTFGSYYEDVDLAFRLRWAGYECAFAPRLPNSPRPLGQLRPQEPYAPASDGPERRGPLLVKPPGPMAVARGLASCGVHPRARALEACPRASSAVRPRQARCTPAVAHAPKSPEAPG